MATHQKRFRRRLERLHSLTEENSRFGVVYEEFFVESQPEIKIAYANRFLIFSPKFFRDLRREIFTSESLIKLLFSDF